MNFTKYFKRKNYDKLDRFLIEQKGHSFRDPFEGDPFKIQSLNFRYADKPLFYPISNRSKLLANAQKAQVNSVYYNQPSHQRLEKDNREFENVRRSSQICSFSDKDKNEKRASHLLPLQRKTAAPKKFEFNRSRSFIYPLTSSQLLDGTEPSTENQAVIKNSTLKPKNIIGTNRSMTAIHVDHSGGCEITIQINGVPGSHLYVNENFEKLDTARKRLEPIKKAVTPTVSSPYELKPSRSYVIRRDEATPNISSDKTNSSKKLLRNRSTHSMIPHREEKNTSQELNAFLSDVDTVRAYSGLKLEGGSRESSQLNKTKKTPHICSDKSNSSKKLLRNCSTHSMIPHREEKNTSLELNAFVSDSDTVRAYSGFKLGGGSQDSSQLNKTKTCKHFSSESVESVSETKSFAPPMTTSRRNLENRALLERIFSNNPIITPPRKSTFLTRSKSVLDQRFTPLPMSGKYYFERKSSKIR